jgi:hypothetical protein
MNWIRRHRWTLVGGVAGAVLSLPLLSFHFCWDHGVYATIADTMMHGGVAYRDAWEFRPPGGFYAYVTAFTLFGRSEVAIRILEIIALAMTSAGLTHLLAKRFQSTWAGLAAAAFLPLLVLPFGHWHTAEPESFQMPFVVWSLALWPPSEEKPGSGLHCALAGILLGLAVVIKTTALFMAPLLMADRLLLDRGAVGMWNKIRRSGLTLLSGAIPSLAVAVYYGARGAFDELWDAVMVFAPKYLHTYGDFTVHHHVEQMSRLASEVLPLCLAICFAWGLVRSFLMRRGETLWLLSFGMIALGVVALQAKYILYHALVVTPFLAACLGLAFVRPLERLGNDAGKRSLVFGRFALGLSFLTVSAGALQACSRVREYWFDLGRGPGERRAHREPCLGYYEGSVRIAKTIGALTDRNDRIFLWANSPLAYFLSGRRMAGPYSSLFLLTAPWLGDRRVHALIDRLEQEKPRLIVVGADDELWVPGDSRKLLEIHSEMKTFLQSGYRRAPVAGNFQYWVRIE